MWKTSLKTAVLQPFTSNLILLSTVILTIALSWQIRFFPEFLVKYNHRIQGKKVVRMPITEEFVKHLMEQNAAMMVSKNRLLTRIAAYASHQAKNRAVRKDTKENTFLSLPIRIM